MIVNDKLVSVHIPKTGGSAVTHPLLTSLLGYTTTGNIRDLSADIKKNTR